MKRLIAMLLFAAATRATGAPTANYNPATGQVVFTDVAFLGGLAVTSRRLALVPLHQYQLPSQPTPVVVDDDSLPNELVWLSTQTPFPDPFNAGVVSRLGIPKPYFHFVYSYWTGSLFGDLHEGIVTPEPSSLTLAALGVLAIMRHASRSTLPNRASASRPPAVRR